MPTAQADDSILHPQVREWQWRHWHAEDDKWKAMGEVFSDLQGAWDVSDAFVDVAALRQVGTVCGE